MKLINIGLDNFVSGEKIVAVVSPDAAPIKRMIQKAKEDMKLIDASSGRKTRSVIFTDNDQIILSCLTVESIKQRTSEEDINE